MSVVGRSMDDLPPPIVVEILSRVGDSADLARCRLASTTLRSLSYDVRAVRLVCSHDRLLRSRAAAGTPPPAAPFRSLVPNLLPLLRHLESLSLAAEESSSADPCEVDESDDLHLTAVNFVSRWLPAAGGRLRSLSISDLWAQSCWRPSEVMALISNCCDRLLNLELRNAWLYALDLAPMPSLASLTLEFIRLEYDDDLDRLCACFPSLESLSLIRVGGLCKPSIRLPRLKTCRWTVTDAPTSVAIDAPNLIDLDLRCVSPGVLSLRTPSLRRLRLRMKRVRTVQVGGLPHLRSLRVEASSGLRDLILALPVCEAVEEAEVEAPACADGSRDLPEPVGVGDLVRAFPCLDKLGLGPGAWRELERSAARGGTGGPSGWRCVRRLAMHLPRPPLCWTVASFSPVLGLCGPLCEVAVHVHEDDAGEAMERLVSTCRISFPEVRWRWGLWRECFEGALLGV